MTGKTHAAIGANITWLFVPFLGFMFSPILIVLGTFGGLLPDIDASESKIKHFEIGYGRGKRRIAIQPFYLPAVIIAFFSRHRGFWHSILGTVVITVLSFVVVKYIDANYVDLTYAHWLATPLGYISHIISDSVTPQGTEWFWPYKKNFHLLPKFLQIRTSGIIDHSLFAIGLLGVAFLLVNIMQSGYFGL